MKSQSRLVVALLGLLLLPARALAADPNSKSPDAKKTDWHSLFDGKALGEWKPTKFATQGEVAVKDSQIEIGSGDGCSGITWTGKFPKSNYEIRLEAMRVD